MFYFLSLSKIVKNCQNVKKINFKYNDKYRTVCSTLSSSYLISVCKNFILSFINLSINYQPKKINLKKNRYLYLRYFYLIFPLTVYLDYTIDYGIIYFDFHHTNKLLNFSASSVNFVLYCLVAYVSLGAPR